MTNADLVDLAEWELEMIGHAITILTALNDALEQPGSVYRSTFIGLEEAQRALARVPALQLVEHRHMTTQNPRPIAAAEPPQSHEVSDTHALRTNERRGDADAWTLGRNRQ